MKESSYIEIDLLKVVKALLKKSWLIIMSAVLVAAIFFGYFNFFVEPTYDADVLFYVDNKSYSIEGSNAFTSSDIYAAKSLVSTYIEILKARLTLEEVQKESGLSYSYNQLKGMISAEAVSETEVFRVRVTTHKKKDSQIIANTIAEVLPQKISEKISGSSVEVIDDAVVPQGKSSPNLTKASIIGFLIGFLLSSVIIIVLELTDTVIHDEEYLTKHFSDIPILAVIPNLNSEERSSSYGYYYSYGNDKNKKK